MAHSLLTQHIFYYYYYYGYYYIITHRFCFSLFFLNSLIKFVSFAYPFVKSKRIFSSFIAKTKKNKQTNNLEKCLQPVLPMCNIHFLSLCAQPKKDNSFQNKKKKKRVKKEQTNQKTKKNCLKHNNNNKIPLGHFLLYIVE